MIQQEHIQPRPYVGEQDLQPLVDLINRCEEHDRVDWGITLPDLRSELTAPGVDPRRDLRIWEDSEGQPVALGQLILMPMEQAIDAFLWLCVLPELRGVELEDAIFAWGRERASEVERERGQPVIFATGARSDDAWRTATIMRVGMKPDRYFFRMGRMLDEPIATPELPEGFVARPVAGADEVPQWVELFNLSFVDHWHFHPLTVEKRMHWLGEGFYKPELDLVAAAPDGTLAAFASCSINEEENTLTGRSVGWVNQLGTRRGFRKLGLGRAMLLEALHRLKAAGVAEAWLGVDAENPTGAGRLYESVGFQVRNTMVHYRF